MTAVTVVLCTATVEEARPLADRLLEEKLAACVNLVGPVASRYWWEGEIAESSEMLLLIKTPSPLASRLRTRIEELHSYDVPEVLELQTDGGLEAYMAWVGKACER